MTHPAIPVAAQPSCSRPQQLINAFTTGWGLAPPRSGEGGPKAIRDIQLLSEVGQALYGDHWQATLAGEIAVSDRSMRRWANGTDAIPWGVWHDIYRRLEARALTLDYWKRELYDRVVIRECEPRPTERFDPEKDWRIEVHEPLDGRHSMKNAAIVHSLSEVRGIMKKTPGHDLPGHDAVWSHGRKSPRV